MRTSKLSKCLIVQIVAVAACCIGCAETTDDATPNRPPETQLASGPPDSIDATCYRVHFSWSGADPDGFVDHFEVVMIDHPAVHDSIVGDDVDRVIVTVPQLRDPRWTRTDALDSTFVTRADTLRRDPRPGGDETPDDVLRHEFERWHTFFIRAVDDDGTADPTPEYRSFNARTLAPTVRLLAPVEPGREWWQRNAVFRWSGEDPIDEVLVQEPDSSRWVLIDSERQRYDRYLGFPDSLYVLPEGFEWSPWRAWNAPDSSGVRATFQGFEHGASQGLIFAVQAKDEAGAITPVFDWQTPGKNNVALIRASAAPGPILRLVGADLGSLEFEDRSRTLRVDVSSGQPLTFGWEAHSMSAGHIVECRYGWDIRNLEDPEEWQECLDRNLLPTVRFSSGDHRLHFEVADNFGVATRATVEFSTHPLTRSRRLLFVDDSEEINPGSGAESREDEQWFAVLRAIASAGGFEFDTIRDVYDVVENGFTTPSIERLFDYEVIVWSVRNGNGQRSALRHLAMFSEHHRKEPLNYLNDFVRNGGKLWICGFRPALQLWPSEPASGAGPPPVNVTSWKHPRLPARDSVGVVSLNYRLGIEMFDVGAVTGGPRYRYPHFCLGFRPVVPGAPALETGPRWGQPAGRLARANIEIYNMPIALAAQIPPLVPPDGRSLVPYTYISVSPEDPDAGVVYPRTADRQPAVLLTKQFLDDAFYSRAICGFEPELLTERSHYDLAAYVLLEQMRIGERHTTRGGVAHQ